MAAKREQGGISTKSAENKVLDSEQKELALRAEISKKDMEIFKLTENRKFLEDEIAAIKHTLAHDKERWEHETEQKVVTIKSLETKVQECEAEVQKVRDIESNKERQFLMEQSQVAASMQAKTEAKISALSCEVMALKECYDTARMACQVSITHNCQWVIVFSNDAEKALEAVTAEKEKSSQFATALKKVLKEQSAKLRMYDNERESWQVKEKKLREDNNKLVRDAEAALTEIRELKTMDLY
jgi:chorismate mutase